MKDKRLDVLLKHFIQEKECHYHFYNSGIGFCREMEVKGTYPVQVCCGGGIIKCELENEKK